MLGGKSVSLFPAAFIMIRFALRTAVAIAAAIASIAVPQTGHAQGGVAFNEPTADGIVVDQCATWAVNCGQAGADQFCRSQGYPGARSFQTYTPGRTIVLGDRRICQGTDCVGFLRVLCSVQSVQAPPGIGSERSQFFSRPYMNTAHIDWCATWAVGCGQEGADQFCRAQGYGRAAKWGMFYADRTFVLGSNRFCEAVDQCGALLDVVCVGFP